MTVVLNLHIRRRQVDVPRLVALGATVMDGASGHDGVRVLTDTAGNHVCVVPDAKDDE